MEQNSFIAEEDLNKMVPKLQNMTFWLYDSHQAESCCEFVMKRASNSK